MKTVIQTRVDSDVRRNAENILCAMGLSLNDGIRMFLHQLITDRAMPFRPNVGNEPNDCLKKCIIINFFKHSFVPIVTEIYFFGVF